MKKLRIHVFQHVPHEGLGTMEEWFWSRGYSISRTAFWQTEPCLPDLEEWDLLVVMGGPMGVYETELYPWLKEELAYLRKAIAAEKVVLGVCLGSQLLAAALDGRVFPHKQKEIGWFPITSTEPSVSDWFFAGETQAQVFHWHGDTFELPQGARLLASSAVTPHQAFLWRDRILGLQFHIETDETSLKAFLASGQQEIAAGGVTVQSAEQMMEGCRHSQKTFGYLESILRYLAAKACE